MLRTENYYDPDGGQVEIPLDPLKTPQQNAARRRSAQHGSQYAVGRFFRDA